ncbi:uncharacterized protein [Montipora capricornis]|uniref:uncharacterized protein isoform X1 n=1 Tax=Montipora capricornis TaxID=246305 RepID=UPI0035F19266
MADDVLAKAVFSFICEFGGYVELSVLLEDVSSPLRGRKSELQARNWLKTQRGVVVIENDGKIEGVRVHLKKKICKQYADKGSCRRAKGKCKFWHICKGFLEGHCGGKCSRSHDFFDNENRVKTQQLGIDKYPNTLVKKIVGRSLPQVCQLYLRGGCNSNKCFRLHVCFMAVQGSHCGCTLSHSLVNNHNRAILNQFDLVPHPSFPIEFVRCSVLVPQILGNAKQLFKEGSSDSVYATTSIKNSTNSVVRPKADTSQRSKTLGDGILAQYATPSDIYYNTPTSSKIRPQPTKEDTACGPLKNFSNNLESISTSSKPEKGAFPPNNINVTEDEDNLNLSHEEKNLANFYSKKMVAQFYLEDNDSTSGTVSRPGFQKANRTSGTSKTVEENKSNSCHLENNMRMFVEESSVQSQKCNPPTKTGSESMFCGNQSNLNFSVCPERAAVVTTYKEPSEMKVFETLCKEYQWSVSFSVISKRRDLFPREFKNVEGWFRKMKVGFLLTESEHGMILQVAAYSRRARICLSYNNGAGKAKCEKQNCVHLHVCREYITYSCINGVTCSRNHNFQDERNKKLLKSIKLDTLTDEVLRKLVLSSTPQACAEYNNGICDRGDSCGRIHICSKHLKKSCCEVSECDLEHDSAMHTRQTDAILKRYQLNYLSRNIVKWIILVCDDSTKSKEAGTSTKKTQKHSSAQVFFLGSVRRA